MDRLDKLLKDSEKINTDIIKKKVHEEIDEGKVFYMKFKWSFGLAAIFLVCMIVTLNMSETFATALSDVPVLGSIVRVVTFGRYEFDEGGYHADVESPKIEGLLDKALEDQLNAEFKENAESVILAFEKDVRELKAVFGDEEVHVGVESGYIVKTDTEDILALDVYIVNTVASSSTVHKFYTINKKTGKLLALSDLFKEDADYVTVLSEYLKGQMIYENENNGGLFWVGGENPDLDFEKIKADQNFYIDSENRLVICFDKYEVAAGAGGSPEFTIPDEVTKDIKKV